MDSITVIKYSQTFCRHTVNGLVYTQALIDEQMGISAKKINLQLVVSYMFKPNCNIQRFYKWPWQCNTSARKKI